MIIVVRALLVNNKWDLKFVLRFVVFALLFSLLLNHFLKTSLGIPRPHYDWPPRPFQLARGYNAFPSGHTVAIITTALPLAFWAGKKSISAFLSLVVTAVCVSRLWLGVHHPVDIAGGIVIGSWAARCIFRPRHPPLKNEPSDSPP